MPRRQLNKNPSVYSSGQRTFPLPKNVQYQLKLKGDLMSDDIKGLLSGLTAFLIFVGMCFYFGKHCNEQNDKNTELKRVKVLQCIQASKDPLLCEKTFPY
jgi:hypothetical protein